jgi:N-acetyl-anhydromuramyl-L-alanine amidase AmpD
MNSFVDSLLTRLGISNGEKTFLQPLRKGMPAPCRETILTSDENYFKSVPVGMSCFRHRLEGAEIIPSPSIGTRIDPKGIVIHFSASYNVEDTIAWYGETAGAGSCHLLLDKVGRFHQMTDFNMCANHAGPSSYWKGYKNLDNFFIGIEVINLGPLMKAGEKYFDCYGRQYSGAVIEMPLMRYKYWEPFTALQLEKLIAVCSMLSREYKFSPGRICGHFECNYGTRIDPGGSLIMSMDALRQAVLANNWETAEEVYSGNV